MMTDEISQQKNNPAGHRERRRFPRYRVKEGALAFLGAVPGNIVDISEAGITVHYVMLTSEPVPSDCLDIFYSSDDFYLPDLPSRLVSDMNSLDETPFSALRVKRLGFQFGELTPEQKRKLQEFIKKNTVTAA